jgi:hypothetical protein
MKIARRTEAPELVSLRQWLKSQPAGRKHRIIEYLGYLCMTILMVLMASIIVYIRLYDFNPWWLLIPAVPLGLALWHPLWMYLDGRGDRRFVKANLKELGPQEFWVDAEGFGNGTPAGSTYHRWPTVSEVHEAGDFTVVIAHPRLYTIPAGDDREEYARFVAELSRFREASAPLPA